MWLSGISVEDGVDILVDYDGPGIPAEDRDRVFQPFVRLDASRNPATGGIDTTSGLRPCMTTSG